MTVYFNKRQSSNDAFGDDARSIIELVSSRYTGANPPIPFALRAFSTAGIMQTAEGLYDMEMASRLPEAKHGDYVYMLGRVWSDDERSIDGVLEPLGPTSLYLNGEHLYRSGAVDEMKPDARVIVPLLFRQGWNDILIEVRRSPAGFGCRLGAEEAKVRILNVLAPFRERDGMAGWVYSEPVSASRFGANGTFPDSEGLEAASGLTWLPATKWGTKRSGRPNAERVFGLPARQAAAYGWTRLDAVGGGRSVSLEGYAYGPTVIWLDNVQVISLTEAGSFRTTVTLESTHPELLIRTVNGPKGWGFNIQAQADGRQLAFELPRPVHGYDGVWLYAGPLDPKVNTDPSSVRSMAALLPAIDAKGRPSGHTYWSVDAPEMRVRPYYENAMLSNKWTTGSATNFGRWDYPLGVTMYGLLRASRTLKRQELADYALRHIRSCTEMYDYSLWDRDQYGFPSVNQQLVLIKMLDNCGSFGSAMLEAYALAGDPVFLRIADSIADFMLNKLERREDGAFYRLCQGEYAANTMWADDLYMSTPFLVRYASATGRKEALDEAAKQFLLFRRYLFIEDERIMSHVYDFKYGQATRMPWGRGNGWVLFSMTELLERLPQDHPDREELLSFFREMCGGIAALQGESGLWRQVLNQSEAYEEASCTAMFTYAFARGVRFGWFEDGSSYTAAAKKAWRGLTEKAIDRTGSVHGVCSGSRYSFSPDYYMYDLRTVINDNHGIGIMMLAGVEIMQLEEALGAGAGAAATAEAAKI